MPQRRSVRNLTSRVYLSSGSLAPWSARTETRRNAREASRGVMLVGLALTLSLATAAVAQPLSGPEYIPLATPCRALDTRVTGPPLSANETRPIPIGGVCGVPPTAVAAALYFAITQAQGAGHMTAWPSGPLPLAAAVNFVPGEDVGNEVDIGLGAGGTVLVQSIVGTDLVVDIYGYFTDVEELEGGNTALGNRALFSNTTGVGNIALGAGALGSNTTGNTNTATGVGALTTNTEGSRNTATGFQALFSNTEGNSNTATGLGALSINTTGNRNTALGTTALLSNTTGNDNTATGLGALGSNTIGENNTASGVAAMQNNTIGSGSTASGSQALFSNISGDNNTASGATALFNNLTGFSNTASGNGALFSNTTGDRNAAFGAGALADTTGSDNTASGANALRANTTGTFNTALGSNANVASGGLTNAMALGANALVDASNKIRLGNASISVIEGQVAFTFPSDQTTKEHFQPVDGEAVLTKLRALTLTSWNYIGHDPAQFRHYGPMAQEFFAAFGYDGIGTIGTPTTLNVGDVAGIVLSAVQALEQRTAALQAKDAQGERQLVAQAKQLAELKAQNARLQAMLAKQQERDAALAVRLERLEAAAARAGALASR